MDLFRHNTKASIGHVMFDESPSCIACGIATSNDHKPSTKKKKKKITKIWETSSIYTSNSKLNKQRKMKSETDSRFSLAKAEEEAAT